MRPLPLKGVKSLRALNAFHALLLGLKMLPAYIGESYESFSGTFRTRPDEEKERFLREAASFVQLEPDEVEALLTFVADDNGVPFSSVNLKNLGPGEILDAVVLVCCEIGKIRIDFVNDAEKKKFQSGE